MHTISGSNLNVVVYETVPHLLAAAWYPVVCQEIYPFLVSRNRQGKIRCMIVWVEDMGGVAITGIAVVPDY
jgi:hypothetical protein